MIKIYTSVEFFNNGEVLHDNEAFFNIIPCKDYPVEFDEILYKIDKAKFIDRKAGTINTPYATTDVKGISTGCKTAMNVIYLNKIQNNKFKAVDVSECGINALEVIFDISEEYNIPISFILEHDDNTVSCKERDYLINGKKHVNNIVFIGANA